MTVRMARNGDAEIAYETFGEPGGVPLLLIMGLGSQMVWWPDRFCLALVERGFQVARFDNRDSGLTTHFPTRRRDPLVALFKGSRRPVPYTGDDMVADGIAVMDALRWPAAHVVGISMGAGLALMTAALHPDRTLTVTSLSGGGRGTGADFVRFVRWTTVFRLMAGVPKDRSRPAEQLAWISRAMHGRGLPPDEDWVRATAALAAERDPDPAAANQRQLTALRAGSRLPVLLPRIRARALFLHGEQDPMARPAASRAAARTVPGARLVIVPRMGHSLPEPLWPLVIDELAGHAGLPSRSA